MANVSTEIQIFNELRRRIAEDCGLDANDEFVFGSAAGECKLEDVITGIIRESRVSTAQAKGLDDLIDSMAMRRERLEGRAERLRTLALWAMGEAGLKRIPASDFTVSAKPGIAPLIITREPDIDDYMMEPGLVRQTITYAWDKKAIRAELDGGAAMSFAYLGNVGSVLSVRGK